MSKLICVYCEIELEPKINGVIVAEMFQENTAIYKLWSADLWGCPKCGVEIVADFACSPLMRQYQGNINDKLEELKRQGKRIIYSKEKEKEIEIISEEEKSEIATLNYAKRLLKAT